MEDKIKIVLRKTTPNPIACKIEEGNFIRNIMR